ncbi:unnamed protein product [Cyclocybe aegerita]|uniref:SET domain-containing protein n=1 Tax=Cyclocybe aegerita TaxID=1973307 RepID=A0A8S0WSR3_CYCAE|nr:unnamed protein product [Cyclocybe aegerita]
MKRGFLNSSKAKAKLALPEPLSAKEETPKSNKESPLGTLPFGKVKDAGIPDDYDGSSKFQCNESHGRRTDYGPNEVVYTTIPSQDMSKPADPDGHSECVISGLIKAKIFNTPGYPCAIPKPRRPNMCVIKPVADMGLGVFATCDIKVGELIFSERPLLVTRRAMAAPTAHIPRGCSPEKVKQILMFEIEKGLQYAASRMSDERRTALMALANSHKEDGSGPILGIIRTNGFSIASKLGDGPAPAPGQIYPPERAYGAVCDLGSRINHSCMPNVMSSFALSSFSMQFTALREIKAGEQLFYCYGGMFQSAADRQKELAPYGFECKCAACVNATPARDKLRIEFEDRVTFLVREGIRNTSDRNFLNRMLQYEKEVVAEGLDSQRIYRFMVALIGTMQTTLGMHREAKRYLELEKAWKEIVKQL